MASNVLAPAVEPDPPDGPRTRVVAPADWRSTYSHLLWISDLGVLVIVVFGTQIAWFGSGARRCRSAKTRD